MPHLTIKVKPEDFIVREIATLPLAANGAYGLWRLTKRDRNTSELLRELSRKWNIPFRDFAYGGRKDRHALTTQYITIKGKRRADFKDNACSLMFVGFMDRAMGPDLIVKNAFEIVVRKLDARSIERALAALDTVKAIGYPNYFDDQRFGSFDSRQGFFAHKLLKQQYNGALKIYLTSPGSADPVNERRRKEFFFENWKQWRFCLEKAATETEKRVFRFLNHHPTAFLTALKNIDREELSIFFSAFQAYLWNELVRRIVTDTFAPPLKKYPGTAGDYLFYPCLSEAQHGWLLKLYIPTPAAKVALSQPRLQKLYRQVLADNGITPAMFGKMKVRAAYFKSFPRSAIVFPEDIRVGAGFDDMFAGRKKLTLKFNLPRGSYATMLIKRIFSS